MYHMYRLQSKVINDVMVMFGPYSKRVGNDR